MAENEAEKVKGGRYANAKPLCSLCITLVASVIGCCLHFVYRTETKTSASKPNLQLTKQLREDEALDFLRGGVYKETA